jgi:internalin A
LTQLKTLHAGGSGNIHKVNMRVFIDTWGIQDISVLQGLNQLQSLDLSGSSIQDISVLQGLNQLQSLDLSYTKVEDISVLQGLNQLQSLYLSGSSIQDISVLQGLNQLQSLDLIETNVSDISVLQGLNQLQSLSLSGSSIQDISVLQGLNQLQSLYLSGSSIQDISVLQGLNQLQSLYLSGSSIQDISVLQGLNQLQSLYLSGSSIQDISVLQGLNQLQSLDLIETNVSDISVLQGLNQLQSLDLSDSSIQDISVLQGLNQLQSLDLSYTKVEDISVLQGLNQLQSLYLSYTKVEDISVLQGLNQLQSLYLSYTKVEDISVLQGLNQLQSLDLSYTKVEDISVLQGLNQLQSLSLSGSSIQDISVLQGLNQLQSLYLSGSSIQDISVLQGLNQLQSLYLRSTQVEDISPLLPLIQTGIAITLGQYDSGKGIHLYDCPLSNPPVEVVKQGNQAILEYFAERELAGEETVYEAKLLIVGEAGTGKTTLARKLCDVHAPMPEESIDTTTGIQIQIETLCEPGKPDFYMHIWDFGGQEIYHSTHQFFLTKRSLYVLLLDGRKEEDPHYWLQVQDLLGEDSPVLLLLNQKGDIQTPLSEQELRGYYGNLKAAYTLNLKDDQAGIEHLQAEIAHHIRNLPHFRQGEKIPRRWVRIREQLENRGKAEPYISLQTYRDICAEIGISEKRKQDILSDFLHSLGVILHFPKEDLLRKMVILRPDWATHAVYQVLDHTKAKADPPGHFRREQLADIWQLDSHQEADAELLALMKRFELCYELPHQQGTYIVPRLLPNDQPTYEWPEDAAQLELRYAYTFMPKGIVTRLIVRQHRYIADQATVWQRGAVFTYQGAYAEVIERYRDRRIHLRAYGPNRRDVLTLLSKDIDELNASFDFDEKLKVEALIPCNCERCRTVQGDEKEYFDRETLLDFKASPISDIQCRKGKTMVSVLGLIGDVFTQQQIQKLSQQYEAPMAKRKPESSSKHEYHFHNSQVNLNADTKGDIHQTINQNQLANDLTPHLDMIRELIEAEKAAGLLDEEGYEEALEVVDELADNPQPENEKQQRRWKRWLGRIAQKGGELLQKRVEKGTDTLVSEAVKDWATNGGGLDLIGSFTSIL